MKASELRIWNLVYGKNIETVKSIKDDYVWFDNNRNLSIELCQPIPLTEEWLLKFGFERQPWGLVKGGLLFKDNIKHPCEELTLEI